MALLRDVHVHHLAGVLDTLDGVLSTLEWSCPYAPSDATMTMPVLRHSTAEGGRVGCFGIRVVP